jgi:class 3 adenylate cyclase
MSAEEQRKLAAIMFTDMVGYSALSQRDEKLAQELLQEHRHLLREIFPRFNAPRSKRSATPFWLNSTAPWKQRNARLKFSARWPIAMMLRRIARSRCESAFTLATWSTAAMSMATE